VSIAKSYAYRNGARPVLYLSPNERNTLGIPRDELWRVVRLEYDYGREDDEVTPIRRADWTHEREWRSRGNFKLPNNCIVFVDKVMEVERLWRNIRKNPDEFRIKPRAILPLSLILSCC